MPVALAAAVAPDGNFDMNQLQSSSTLKLPAARPSLAPQLLGDCPDTRQHRLDDWVTAFATRLTALGAEATHAELTKLGRSLYPHYDLLDPYQIARMVWRRWSAERSAKAKATAQAPRAKSGRPGVPGSGPC